LVIETGAPEAEVEAESSPQSAAMTSTKASPRGSVIPRVAFTIALTNSCVDYSSDLWIDGFWSGCLASLIASSS
jgi:hypothetical protein